MKDIVNQFKGYIDKLPDDKKQSLAKTIGTVLGLGAGAGVGSIIGSSLSSSSDEGSSQYPINSGITPNTNIVTKDSMAEMFPYSDTSTGEGIYSYREGTVTEAVEKISTKSQYSDF